MPRKGSLAPSTLRLSACFNEAGAVMPRKGLEERETEAPADAGFNEAGAVMPRKGHRSYALLQHNEQASMRPGQ